MDVSDLLQHDLGFGPVHELDMRPPAALLEMLAQRSGVELDLLHSMTLAGWTPWLLDSLDPEPSAFETYAYQFSVLLPLHKRSARIVSNWTAWRPKQAIRRACPECISQAEDTVLLLMWQLPLLLSCPQHGCWLEPFFCVVKDFIGWEAKDELPRQANEAITKMDRRTWQALTTGQVELPSRSIHAGLWFRLLRTVLEELNTPLSRCSSQARYSFYLGKLRLSGSCREECLAPLRDFASGSTASNAGSDGHCSAFDRNWAPDWPGRTRGSVSARAGEEDWRGSVRTENAQSLGKGIRCSG
jgi:hypothetical protein